MNWGEPETWIALMLAAGVGAGGLRAGSAAYRRYSMRPPPKPRRRGREPERSEPPRYDSEPDE